MTERTGDLATRPLARVLEELHREAASGVLEIGGAATPRRLHMRSGELYLAATNPLARKLAEGLLELRALVATAIAPTAAPLLAARSKVGDVLSRMVEHMAEWKQGEFRFLDQKEGTASELAGPLPTRRMIALLLAARTSDRDALARLGGGRGVLVATAERGEEGDLFGFDPEELLLLERLREPIALDYLFGQLPFGRGEALRRLVVLAEMGTVRPVRDEPAAVQSVADLDRELVERFEERIGAALAEDPLTVDAATFRSRVGDLLSRAGGLTYYEFLEVSPAASAEEIHRAFERGARLLHPSNAERFAAPETRRALAILFEQATRAYVTLSDSERRRRYNQEASIDLAQPVSGAAREEERRTLARQHFERANQYAAASEFHFAIEMLQSAVQLDPKLEYLAALAKQLARNPNWRRRALETYRRALELEPRNVPIRFSIAKLYEELGDNDRARIQYSAVLREDPNHEEASARLGDLVAPGKNQGSGIFGRLFGKPR